MWICVFENVRIRARWIGPYAWRNVRTQFRGWTQHYRKPLAAVGADLSCPHIWIHPRNGRRKCVFGEMDMCIWWCEYAYLIMQGYGRDESAPTPGGVFAAHFVGERNIINNPSAALSQTVSSRRGRFIVPAYMMYPRNDKRKCACGDVEIRI